MHVTVCICTYKRPQFLKRLIESVARQVTEGLFTFSVVVVDNDSQRSAEPTVSALQKEGSVPIVYDVEPEQNIACARNRALANAHGDFIALIDDDEFPIDRWLLLLFKCYHAYDTDGVLAPVVPHFEHEPPKWVLQGKFFDRPRHTTGFMIGPDEGRTGNFFFHRKLIKDSPVVFKPEFRSGGEDRDFFFRMMRQGARFVWCDEAVAYETVPPHRWNFGFMVKRALLRGSVSLSYETFKFADIVKSFLAVAAYLVAMPFLAFAGQHAVVRYFVKLCDHLGRIIAFLRIKPVKEVYVTGT